jgi:beta-glucosidase
MFHTYVPIADPEQPAPYGQSGAAQLIRSKRMTHFAAQGSPSSGREMAEWFNAVQRVADEHPLRIPVTISSDPRHSVTDNPLTTNSAGALSRWPEPIGIAAIASEEVARQYGDISRREYVAAGIRVALGPQIDLSTEPRWARITQTFGEDADLTGRLVRAYLEGFQGDTFGHDSVSAMAKHFPGGGPQKDGMDPHFEDGKEQIYPGGKFEYHLQPFIDALQAGVRQMMPYYGMPVGAEYDEVGFAFNKQIITDLLRERLGFTGIVCTDFTLVTGYPEVFPAKAWGVEELSQEERVIRLLDAGVDQLGGEHATELLVSVVKKGLIPESRLDESARRILAEKFLLGLFDDRRYVDEDTADQTIGSEEFIAAGRRAQQQSMVLLRNTNSLLPLQRGIKLYLEGVDPTAFDGYATVVSTPGEADVAVLRTTSPDYRDASRGFLGSMHMGSLEYPAEETARLKTIALEIPTVLDVYLERPAVLTGLDSVAALLGTFGTDDAPFVEVLFGDSAPEGQLPFDLPSSMDAVIASRTDVPFDTEAPLFRFGHGLRYDA